jgi:hypothetical protein
MHLQLPVNARVSIVRDTLSDWAAEAPTVLTRGAALERRFQRCADGGA